MSWLFRSHDSAPNDLLKAGESAVARFEKERQEAERAKESLMKRQVEIWSVSSSSSSAGLEEEYRIAATGVALNVKKILCLDEHITKLRLSVFHAKDSHDTSALAELLKNTDPCANIVVETEKVDMSPTPQGA